MIIDSDKLVAHAQLVHDFDEEERHPPAWLACYRCGCRMYFSARVAKLGLCSPCLRGNDRRDIERSILTNIQIVEWSPYV